MKELERYKISVAALQETKWFNDAVYKVGESIVIATGRPIPPVGETRQRGEEVAVVLSGPAVQAIEGLKLTSCNSYSAYRKVYIRLHSHTISCCAPTFSASRADKEKFKNEVQLALNAIPPSECYVIMGDFNARVGSRQGEGDIWASVRGPHGLGEMNLSGQELLAFLSINEATLCNIWFCKKTSTNRLGNTPRRRSSTALILPLCGKEIEGDALMRV